MSRGRKFDEEAYLKNPKLCLNCGAAIGFPKNDRPSQVNSRVYCSRKCSALRTNSLRTPDSYLGKIVTTNTCLGCGQPFNVDSSSREKKYCKLSCYERKRVFQKPELVSKGELFKQRASWQAARSVIQDDARKKFTSSGKEQACLICGYNKHVDVCHIVGVSEFSESATVAEINSPANLIALCKNHHWEFDHDLMSEEDRKKIAA